MADAWTREEIELIVADYRDMLLAELRGVPYSKTERRRSLRLKGQLSALNFDKAPSLRPGKQRLRSPWQQYSSMINAAFIMAGFLVHGQRSVDNRLGRQPEGRFAIEATQYRVPL